MQPCRLKIVYCQQNKAQRSTCDGVVSIRCLDCVGARGSAGVFFGGTISGRDRQSQETGHTITQEREEKTMKNLQEKIGKMLQGEKKRREIAIKFLEKLTKDIQDVAMELWGEQHLQGLDTYAVWLWETKMSKKIKKDIYFRYKWHKNERTGNEFPGFYVSQDVWQISGADVELEKGTDFWWAIRTIVEWLPELQEEMENKGISRDKLSANLLRFIKE